MVVVRCECPQDSIACPINEVRLAIDGSLSIMGADLRGFVEEEVRYVCSRLDAKLANNGQDQT